MFGFAFMESFIFVSFVRCAERKRSGAKPVASNFSRHAGFTLGVAKAVRTVSISVIVDIGSVNPVILALVSNR